ncbi:hypothetical protein [Cohnella terricola]|uniref:Uncharacterized protein n=1 Tax=Cohnella terricola TaxID=1289167 RepID=A0A559JN66_9BACL|nr:hypothetical protein [Cohnella terricola]TVY01298.1 hypothetical protein FPZ45_09125 [Cohnella terricola]
MESLIYITVYTLEAFCMLSTGYMLFRFPFKEFFWRKLILCIFLAVFSHLLRDLKVVNEFTIIVPLTYLICFTLFIHFVSKIRLVWASVIMTTGYAAVGIVQMIVLMVFDAFGVTMGSVQSNLFYLSLVQIFSAVILLSFSFLYYYRGAGFTYEFPSWRRKHIWLVLLVLIMLALILQFVFLNNLYMVISVGFALIALLILSRKMEKEERLHELEQ